jgi:hypothetical protein
MALLVLGTFSFGRGSITVLLVPVSRSLSGRVKAFLDSEDVGRIGPADEDEEVACLSGRKL